jgi:formylglycine-generating enzyme required for sulfatase activity
MNVVTTAMVQIPKGVLTYGLPECPPNGNIHWRWHSGRKVEVAAFQLGKYAVTNAEYREYVKATGAPAPSHIDKAGFNDDKQPVGGISWDDARGYCKWLSAQTGKAFRLPSDAEWEYAARGGKEGTRFSWGESLDPRQACFGGTAAPVPVGMFPANGFGLHDMIGNVWQWCEDKYEDCSYGIKAKNNPTGKPTADNRVLRGGSYLTTNLLNLWIAYRHEDPMDLRHECLGFRVAL